MSARLTIATARPAQRTAALSLVFQHMPDAERAGRVANALQLIERGEVNSEGLFVAESRGQVLGAVICMPAPGASGLVWPPQAIEGPKRQEIEDRILSHAAGWLRRGGAKLAQALLIKEELHLAPPLERNGFGHITSLWYMRHALELTADLLPAERLTYRTYPADREGFHTTLLRTYVDSQDCPEVTGIRTIDEIIAGHRAQGNHRPERWWLALDRNNPVGVLLLTEMPDWSSWDVSYVGVVPEARGRGFGRELVRKAIVEARVGGAAQLTLSVDARNGPAWNLYRRLGFEAYDQREVFLALWPAGH
jgi:ribosomal protein S18 acetylase RimI-like enzyme